ncbi:MAG: bifunctional phosphoribosylaminoimidazolecarboxamide formyltransferase/IMP cyclohydrolase [Pseudomonadota bacterium]
MPDKLRKVSRALLSVSDKTGLIPLAQQLAARGIELVSTGGTAKALSQAGLDVRDVSALTGFPEMMDGRLKTLHPRVHGGLLAVRDNDEHAASARDHDIAMIDLLVVNLYPFEQTVANDSPFEDCIENIDIGGPAMIRAAAKNHDAVTVVVDAADYEVLIAELTKHDGCTSLGMRRSLAGKAYAKTAAYDTAVAQWFADQNDDGVLETTSPPETVGLPQMIGLSGQKLADLRYGENSHQKAAFYAVGKSRPGVATAVQHQGKALSYNNINDTDAAFELVCEFPSDRHAAVAIIKHANPCGVASALTATEAYHAALKCDPTSAFGGIVALNCELDAAAAEAIIEIFTEVVIAPSATEEAHAIFARKKNLRLLTTGAKSDPTTSALVARSVAGGLLVQSRDDASVSETDLRVVTKRQPTDQEMRDMLFAFRVAKHVKSNAIVYARNGATLGIGAGQMSRVDSARIAAVKARDAMTAAEGEANPQKGTGSEQGLPLAGSAVASDAFFPFADGLVVTAEAGATAVIQPGGSVRDDEVIAAADERNLAMVFTGVRHFRH